MPSTTPLTDAINALTQYANETTGQSDTTLSDAVGTLVAGYGGGGGSVLPDGYTQMLFIQSNANQYIDTGLYTKSSHTYYLQYMRGADSAVTINIFGNNVTGCASFVQDGQNKTSVYYQFGTTAYQNFTQNTIGIRTMKLDINGCYAWNDSTLEWETVGTITGSTVTENSNIHNILFGRTTGTNLRQLGSVRLFRFKVEDNGVAVRDMYPAMRNLDGVLGMYDTVNDVFYTNAGTGTFTGGIAA